MNSPSFRFATFIIYSECVWNCYVLLCSLDLLLSITISFKILLFHNWNTGMVSHLFITLFFLFFQPLTVLVYVFWMNFRIILWSSKRNPVEIFIGNTDYWLGILNLKVNFWGIGTFMYLLSSNRLSYSQ